jgi:RNA polymerase sigma-70 factor (ECF subfamily)
MRPSGGASEAAMRRLFDSGDRDAAATEAIRTYGPEIAGLLLSLLRDEQLAADAFSTFAEQLWRSLAAFEWRCSMRTWAYVLARRAAHDARRMQRRHAGRAVSLSDASEVARLAARVRTETFAALRSEVKSELAKLRETLSEADQLLLVLRVDRGLEWHELALVFIESGDDTSAPAVKRESARLRKRFQLVKDRLRTLARERGLLRE